MARSARMLPSRPVLWVSFCFVRSLIGFGLSDCVGLISHLFGEFYLNLGSALAVCLRIDVIHIERTNETFRLLYDVKGRFKLHRITTEEAKYKLCKVNRAQLGPNSVPYIATHDGRYIRYPDPLIKVDDTVMIDINTGKVIDFAKYDLGNLVMVTGGHNIGRVGTIVTREKHPGSTEIVRIRDANGHDFATRKGNVFIIGKGTTPLISLPKEKGIKKTIIEEFEARSGKKITA
uniref:40S ribosomal protein S4 n=1 Tax=Rhodosorus marinus TaxID=101924 RepID=A0A7S2ZFM7_9RHOD|mmetsp:Transcript_16693/g.68373  ORF Transcript_16693/g.68373 Transcript_16693/m.68373 type:complete len:233 (+) Transcript_16693:117-815(+)